MISVWERSDLSVYSVVKTAAVRWHWIDRVERVERVEIFNHGLHGFTRMDVVGLDSCRI